MKAAWKKWRSFFAGALAAAALAPAMVAAGVLAASLTAPTLFAQAPEGEGLPGDPARVNYELGFAYLLRGERDRARGYLEAAAGAQGAYADLARLELVRLTAENPPPPGDQALPAVRQILLELEDRTQLPQAWHAAVQSLATAGRRGEALELALEAPLRFPRSPWSARSLLVAARINYEDRRPAAAQENLLNLLENYAGSDAAPAARLLLAELHGTRGPLYDPFRACRALRVLEFEGRATDAVEPATADLSKEDELWNAEMRDFYQRFCIAY